MNNLKPLVNDNKLWNSFNDELDRRLNHVHIQMEQTMILKSIDYIEYYGVKQYHDMLSGLPEN